MTPSDRKALVFAAVLHVLLIGVLLFVAQYSTSRADTPPVMVMEMFAPPPASADDMNIASVPSGGAPAEAAPSEPAPAEPAPEAPAPQPALRQPDIVPIAQQSFEALLDVPPLPEPEPEPAPTPAPAEQPAPTPAPKPAPAKPQPSTPKPAANAPKPQPQQAQQPVMTAEQFRQQMGLPKQARAPQPTRQTPSPSTPTGGRGTGTAPVRIDTTGVTQALNNFLAGSGNANVTGMSASDQSALLAYFGRLRSNINAAWVLPADVSDAGEWAEVQITIEADGRISSVRISRHSGSKPFLDSIERAVRAARSAGPTPSRQRQHVRYTFNLRDM